MADDSSQNKDNAPAQIEEEKEARGSGIILEKGGVKGIFSLKSKTQIAKERFN